MATPKYVTLTANVATTVDVTSDVRPAGSAIKVTTDDSSTAPVYFRTDGAAAVVGADGCEVVLSGGRNYEVAGIAKTHNALTGADGTATVSLISAATAWVKIEVVAA